MKKCRTCNLQKPLTEFNKKKRNKDGFDNQCRLCEKEYFKKYNKSNKESLDKKRKEYYQVNKEKIIIRLSKDYKKNIHIKKKYNTEYYNKNKNKILEQQKIYGQLNKQKIKKYKELNKKRINENCRNRFKNDNLYKLKKNLRNRTCMSFKAKGYKKNSKTQEMLGVDWEVCKAHIERQFTKGMSWDNSAEWHIDHIIPLASANTEEELKKLCHYSNLQPLWAFDNLIKSAKINGQQNKFRF